MRLFFVFFMVMALGGCGNQGLIRIDETDPEGIIRKVYFIDSDSLAQGTSWTFYENGIDTFERLHYLDGQIHGARILYYPNGIPEIVEHYDQGLLSGPVKTFFKDGTLAFESVYSDGVLEGRVVTYYPNGARKEEVTFEDNLENGPFVEFFANGKKSWEGTYLNGEYEIGLLTQYDSTGVVFKKMMCDSLAICRTIWTREKGDIVAKN